MSADGASSTVVDINDPTDTQMQLMENERLILQLKEMIRDRESTLVAKDAELKVSNWFVWNLLFHDAFNNFHE